MPAGSGVPLEDTEKVPPLATTAGNVVARSTLVPLPARKLGRSTDHDAAVGGVVEGEPAVVAGLGEGEPASGT